MNITSLKSELQGILHGTTLNKVNNIDRLIDRASRTLLLDLDPQETIRAVEMDPIFDKVYIYPAPTDLKGNAILDIRPQVQRTLRDNYSQTYSQNFDIMKEYSLQANYNVQFNTGIKTLEINAPLLNTGVTLNECDSLTGNGVWSGTVSDITIDNVNYAGGSGALKFNLTATGQYIETTMPTGIDLTTHLNQSNLFFWVYLPEATHFTSVALRFGTDSSNYYTTGNVTLQQDGTTLQDGWNLVKGDWSSTTGTPDITLVKYLRVTYNTDGTAITGVKLNEIVSRMGQIMKCIYYSKYMFRDVSTGAFKETVTADSDLINLDTETYNVLLNLVALYCVQQLYDGSSVTDTKFFQDAYNESLKRYKGLYKSQRNKPKLQYYRKSDTSYRRFFGNKMNY